MEPEQQRLAEVVDAILRYLHSHPDAADTAEGIAKWWLSPECCADPRTLQAALARMQEQGLIQRRTNADRHVVYSR